MIGPRQPCASINRNAWRHPAVFYSHHTNGSVCRKPIAADGFSGVIVNNNDLNIPIGYGKLIRRQK